MKVFMKKDVVQVGKAGIIITVPDGFARNYLLPKGLAIEVTNSNESSFKQMLEKKIVQKETAVTKRSLLADRIANMKLTLKRKLHDDGKLYASINAHEIVDLLAQNDINITKSQVIFDKVIKTKGTYSVSIKLTSQLLSSLEVRVIGE